MTPALIDRFVRSPQTLFLVDGAGAVVTALLVGVVLPRLGEYIGTPRPVLRTLALGAVALAAYSLTCAAVRPTLWPGYVRGIALANVSYCLVTAAVLIRFAAALQVLDWLYFLGEIVVVGALATLELRVARAITPNGAVL